MKMYKIFIILCLSLFISVASGQNKPWENALKMAISADGKSFGPISVFQDSAGVPSLCRKNRDTLMAVFQWFRGPQGSPTWDRVAVKYSYNDGMTWTEPMPIQVHGLPAGYQRPFDPTLVPFAKDSFRLFYSSSRQMPTPGQDSIIDCHSAWTSNGLDYYFESGARVDEANKRVIDPAVVQFKGMWHYAAPKGAPQDGAFHFISSDGLSFSKVPDIMSDALHNWTGNYLVADTSELRFYGSGTKIWYNSSSNGGVWSGYQETNISQGGDPAVVRLNNDSFLMVYVGINIKNEVNEMIGYSFRPFPNPIQAGTGLTLPSPHGHLPNSGQFRIFNITGQVVQFGEYQNEIYIHDLSPGMYICQWQLSNSGNEKPSSALLQIIP